MYISLHGKKYIEDCNGQRDIGMTKTKKTTVTGKLSAKKAAAEAKVVKDKAVLDDRRRLEDRLEEMRVARETREFDFDVEMEM